MHFGNYLLQHRTHWFLLKTDKVKFKKYWLYVIYSKQEDSKTDKNKAQCLKDSIEHFSLIDSTFCVEQLY